MNSIRRWSGNELHRRQNRIRSTLIVLSLLGIVFLYNWVVESIAVAHISPRAERINIETWIKEDEITTEVKNLLSHQTGLSQKTIEKLLTQGRGEELLKLQEQYFAPVRIRAEQTTPLTVSECLVNESGEVMEGMPLVDLQDGDILVTKNSRFLGWRNGHAGLVIDAEKGLVLEAIMLGTDTKISSVKKWSAYPSFQVLRLKEEYALRGKGQENGESSYDIPQLVAEYAGENLLGIPYGLLAGVFDGIITKKSEVIQTTEKPEEELSLNLKEGIEKKQNGQVSEVTIKTTHCAHLVWYAYKQFGIDLDSDGGLLVTPYDIQKSECLETIQSYGY